MSRVAEFLRTATTLGPTPRDRARLLWALTKNLRVRVGVARHHPEREFQVRTRFGTLTLRDNFGDITNLHDLLVENVYGLGTLRHEGVIVDAGANIGLFAAWAAHHNPGRSIYCFEPLASNAALIRKNCPPATVFATGLGARREVLALQVDASDVMASSIATRWPTARRELAVAPLDEVAEAEGIEQIAFLKIDTEGMELDVLDGAARMLRRTRQVSMETHGPELHTGSLARLEEAGFVIDASTRGETTGFIRASRPGA